MFSLEVNMKPQVITKEAILSVGKEIVAQAGITALNMRHIAQRCNISVGSVYNYFPSKGDLIIATIESVWQEIIYDSTTSQPKIGFLENIQFLFGNIQKGSTAYPSFFTLHPTSLATMHKKPGRDVMHQYFASMKKGLLTALEQDPKVREDVFSETFTESEFIDFVFSNILTLLMHEKVSCDYLLEIIKRILY